jgi:hypothetical protein
MVGESRSSADIMQACVSGGAKWYVFSNEADDLSEGRMLIHCDSGEDVSDYTIHVRFIRQHIPSHYWHRLSVEGAPSRHLHQVTLKD